MIHTKGSNPKGDLKEIPMKYGLNGEVRISIPKLPVLSLIYIKTVRTRAN